MKVFYTITTNPILNFRYRDNSFCTITEKFRFLLFDKQHNILRTNIEDSRNIYIIVVVVTRKFYVFIEEFTIR